MNARICLLLALAALAFGLSACSSAEIEITYQRPPGKDIPDYVKSVGVVPFNEGKLVSEKGIGEQIQKKIQSKLVNGDYYKVVTRDRLKTLLKEQKLSFASFAGGNRERLKIQMVDAMIMGTITRAQCAEKKGSMTTLTWVAWGRGPAFVQKIHGMKRPKFKKLKRGRYITAEVAMTFEMIDYKGGGTILASHEFQASYNSRSAVEHDGKRYALPAEELPTSHVKKLEELIMKGAGEFLAMIAPSTVTQTVKLIDRGPDSTEGVALAKRNLVDMAIQAFDEAILTEDPKDAAYYDKGVMLEIQGKYREALEHYKQAWAIEKDGLYLDAIERINKELQISDE